MKKLIRTGMPVAPYGLKTSREAADLPEGYSGYFTDDPWTK